MRICYECKKERKIKGRGRCSGCYKRMMKQNLPNDYISPFKLNGRVFKEGHIPHNKGTQLDEARKQFLSNLNMGNKNPRWQGKHVRSHHTYRKIISRNLRRRLKKGEVVHHKDGDHTNNSKENILIFPNHSEHMKFHWKLQKSDGIRGRIQRRRKLR